MLESPNIQENGHPQLRAGLEGKVQEMTEIMAQFETYILCGEISSFRGSLPTYPSVLRKSKGSVKWQPHRFGCMYFHAILEALAPAVLGQHEA